MKIKLVLIIAICFASNGSAIIETDGPLSWRGGQDETKAVVAAVESDRSQKMAQELSVELDKLRAIGEQQAEVSRRLDYHLRRVGPNDFWKAWGTLACCFPCMYRFGRQRDVLQPVYEKQFKVCNDAENNLRSSLRDDGFSYLQSLERISQIKKLS